MCCMQVTDNWDMTNYDSWTHQINTWCGVLCECSGVATPGPARARAQATSFWARAIIISSQG